MVSRPLVAVASLLMVALLPMPAAGQVAGGALYLTSTVVKPLGGCDGTPEYQMGEAIPVSGKAYSALTVGGAACPFGFVYTATQASVLTGEFRIALTVGCDAAGAAIEMDYAFAVAGKTVASLRPAVTWTCTPSSALAYTQTFDAKDTPVAVGDELRLTFSLFAAAAGPGPAGNWHVKVGDAATPSGLFGAGLPGTPSAAPADATPVLLNGTTASIGLDLAEPTTGARLYTWPTNLTQARLLANATLTSGSVTIEVLDGANATVANRTVQGSNATVDDAATATAGNWTIRLTLDNATGQVQVTLGAIPPATPGGSQGGTSSGTRSGTSSATDDEAAVEGNATSEDASGGEEGAPAPNAALLALALVAVAVLARRRKA